MTISPTSDSLTALTGGLILYVLYIRKMSDYKTYAAFNTMTIAGRVANAEVKEGQYGEYLSVTLYTELMDDGPTHAVQFTIKGSLLGLAKKGHLENGRRLTVTGHMSKFEVIYFNEKQGKYVPLQKPRLTLVEATILPGGLGAPAKTIEHKQAPVDAPIDMAPPMPSDAEKLASVGA